MYYINNFFLYSILGFIVEYIMYLLVGYEGGFLYGPWTPIYGVGSIFILFIYNRYIEKLKHHKIIKFLIVFLTGFILLSLIEFIGGYLLEFLFHKTIWDYSDYDFNIGKYICLEMALVWGILSLVIVYITKRFSDKIVKKIPKLLTWILIILFTIDLTFSILSNI